MMVALETRLCCLTPCWLSFSSRVPALPVKNLNGTGPVHPALAGKDDTGDLTIEFLGMGERIFHVQKDLCLKL